MCVGIHDEDRLVQGVQEDAVGRFLADSVNPQKLFTEIFYGGLRHPVQVPSVDILYKTDECLQTFCLEVVISGGSYPFC